MKQTDSTPKIALFNMSESGMNSEFDKFVRELSRAGHELVACGKNAKHLRQLGLSVTETGKLVTRDCGLSKISVAVLDRYCRELEYLRSEGGTNNTPIEDLIYDLLDNDPSTTIISDSMEYGWLIKKFSNVHGVTPKDKNWLAVQASVVFGFERDQVLSLLRKIKPWEPRLQPAY